MLTPSDIVHVLKSDGTFDDVRKLVLTGFLNSSESDLLKDNVSQFMEKKRKYVKSSNVESLVDKVKLQKELTNQFESFNFDDEHQKKNLKRKSLSSSVMYTNLTSTLKSTKYLSNTSFTNNLHELIKKKTLQLAFPDEESISCNAKEFESHAAIFENRKESAQEVSKGSAIGYKRSKIYHEESQLSPSKSDTGDDTEKNLVSKTNNNASFSSTAKIGEVSQRKSSNGYEDEETVAEPNVPTESTLDLLSYESAIREFIPDERNDFSKNTLGTRSPLKPTYCQPKIVNESEDDVKRISDDCSFPELPAACFLDSKIGCQVILKKATTRSLQLIMAEIVSIDRVTMTATVIDQSRKKPKKLNVSLFSLYDFREAIKNQKIENGDSIVYIKENGDFVEAIFTRNYQSLSHFTLMDGTKCKDQKSKIFKFQDEFYLTALMEKQL